MKYSILLTMVIVFSSGCVNNKTTISNNQKQDASVYNPSTGHSTIKVDAAVLYEALNDPNTVFLKQ